MKRWQFQQAGEAADENGEPLGSSTCPYCGLDYPHPHDDEELLFLRLRKAAREPFEDYFEGYAASVYRGTPMYYPLNGDWSARFEDDKRPWVWPASSQFTYYSSSVDMLYSAFMAGVRFAMKHPLVRIADCNKVAVVGAGAPPEDAR